MGNTKRDATTPLSAIFFKTGLVGAVVGIVISVTLSMLPWTQGGVQGVAASPLILLSGASLGGALGAGSAALALGCHALARNMPATLQTVAAGVGGGVGVGVQLLLVLGPAIRAGNSVWLFSLCMLAGAAWAVAVTRPLRADNRTKWAKPAR